MYFVYWTEYCLTVVCFMRFESETQPAVFVKAVLRRGPACCRSHERPVHNRTQSIDWCTWCTLDVTQLLAPINPLSPLCIPLQHPKLPSRVPGLTGIYWSWHGPSDYDVFYDSLDGSFIALVDASGFWWWTWWSQSRRRGEERRGRQKWRKKNRENNRERERQSDVLEGRV